MFFLFGFFFPHLLIVAKFQDPSPFTWPSLLEYHQYCNWPGDRPPLTEGERVVADVAVDESVAHATQGAGVDDAFDGDVADATHG